MKKKLLGALLCIAMAATLLVGCGESKDTQGDANQGGQQEEQKPSGSEEQKPEGEEQEPAGDAAGKKVTALFFSLEGEFFTIFDGFLKEGLTELGYEYESQSSNMDPVLQIEQIENAVANGTDALWIWSINGKAISDACKAAKDKGVIVYSFVQDPGEDARTMFRGNDQDAAGRAIAQLAIDWADKDYGADAEAGSIKTVLMGDPSGEESKATFDALQDEISKDPRFEILEAVGISTSTVEAQNTTENMYSKYGEIDAFITCGGEMALGVCGYLTSDTSPVEDPTKIGVFGTEINGETAKWIKDGVIKGNVVNGGLVQDNVAVQVGHLDALLKGETLDPVSYVEMGTVTLENLADYGY